jgi:hypothetical protein
MIRTAAAELVDANGVAFSRVRGMLPEQCSTWHPVHRVTLTGRARWKFFDAVHAAHDCCLLCGWNEVHGPRDRWLEAHHLPKRSDERTAIILLCNRCHSERVTNGWLPRLLWAKWKWDCENLDWTRLTMIYSSWLPEPEPPPNGAEFWPYP